MLMFITTYRIHSFRRALHVDNQSRKTGNTAIEPISAEMLKFGTWWQLVVLHTIKTAQHSHWGAVEYVFGKFLSEYIPDIAVITMENAKNCCTDRA